MQMRIHLRWPSRRPGLLLRRGRRWNVLETAPNRQKGGQVLGRREMLVNKWADQTLPPTALSQREFRTESCWVEDVRIAVCIFYNERSKII